MSASPIDQLVARRVLELGLVRQEILPALLARATANGRTRGGSLVAAALVEEGHVPAATIDAILRSLAPAAGPRSGEWSRDGSATFGATSGATSAATSGDGGAPRPADGTFAPGAPLESSAGTLADAVRPPSGGASTGSSSALDHTIVEGGSHGPAVADAPTSPTVERALSGERYEVLEERDALELPVLDRRIRRRVLMRTARAPGTPEAQALLHAARVIGRLDHPAIPKAHDVGLFRGRPFYTLDEVEGPTLEDAREGARRPTLPELIRAFLDVAAAVASAHEKGVVHGRLDAACVHLGARGRVQVTGWERARPGDPQDDVAALGELLASFLEAGEPRELQAIADLARAPDRADAYASVAVLTEEVRRFLDGRRVHAGNESLAGAVRRLARRHPAPAAIVLAGAVGLALVAGETTRRVGAAWVLAREARAHAAKQRETARSAASVARAAAGSTASAIAAAGRRLELEETLARAGRAAHAGASAADADAEFDRADALARSLATTDKGALAVARRARARWLLDAGRPDDALAAYRALAIATPDDAAAQLGRFVAARRVPGPEAAADERAALEQLARLPGFEGDLGRASRALGEATEKSDREAAKEIGKQLDALAKSHADSALLQELLGTAWVGAGDQLRGFRHWVTASHLDPLDPVPSERFVRGWFGLYKGHALERFVAGWSTSQLLRASDVTRRPDPLVDLVELVQSVNQIEETRRVVEKIFERPRASDPRSTPELWTRAVLARARARLVANEPALDDLQPLASRTLPPDLALQARALLARALFAAGRQREAGETLASALELLREPGFGPRGFQDLISALADRRADPRAVLPVLDALIPPPGSGDNEGIGNLVAIRAGVRARAGMDPRADIQRAAPHARMAGSRAALELRLAQARLLLAHDARDPRVHVDLLLASSEAHVVPGETAEPFLEARALLAERLRAIGRGEAARRFEAVQGLGETWVRRAWVPEELDAK